MLDLAVANLGDNSVTILLGKGDGTFAAAANPVAVSNPESIVVADFNGDGIPDLAVTSSSFAGTVMILLGKGDGTFTAMSTSPSAGEYPYSTVVADFNGDGIPDLVVGSAFTGSISILLGKGDGTFASNQVSLAQVGYVSGMACGDFNGDGKVDLAITSESSTVAILLGNGDGTFVAAPSVSVDQYGAAIVAGDFNGDGNLDLAMTVAEGSASLTILLGNGDGTFTAADYGSSTPQHGTALALGDFSGNGVVDLAIPNVYNQTITVYQGKGDGTFAVSGVTPATGDYSTGIAVGDFNDDGKPDIAVANNADDSVTVLLAEPTQTATATTSGIVVVGAGQHQAEASFPGDSNYNASVSTTTMLWGEPPTTATTLAVTSGGAPVTTVAAGSLVTLTATVAVGTSPLTTGQVNFCDASATYCTDIHLLGTAQLTSNGTATFKFVPDAGQHSYKATFLENGGGVGSSSGALPLTVNLAAGTVYPTTTAIAQSGTAGNYTLTGTVTGTGGSVAPTGSVSFLDTSYSNTVLGTAALGTATPGISWLNSQSPATGTGPTAVAVADFNQDGRPDLAVMNQTGGTVTILLGKGDGTFTASSVSLAAGSTPMSMAVGDFNGDGIPDLAIAAEGSSYKLIILLGKGDGTFTQVASSPTLNNISGAMVVGDFNGDGIQDLVMTNNDQNSLTIFLGHGDGTFSSTTFGPIPISSGSALATGDFNGDGNLDVAVLGYSGHLAILLGNGDGTFVSTTFTLPVNNSPDSIEAADFNRDGKLDLVLGDSADEYIMVLLGNGDGTFTQPPIVTDTTQAVPVSLAVGDFNGDGVPDLAAANKYGTTISILLGNGDGTFTAETPLSGMGSAVVAGDFNGDGKSDLATPETYANTVSVLLAQATQTSTATVTGIATTGAGPHQVDASYPGDANYVSSTSGTTALTSVVATPVISLASGTYTSIQTVSITDSTPGATIYYTTYGDTPSSSSTPYKGPITVSAYNETIQAIAIQTGYQQSAVASATYTLNLPPPVSPVISLPSGTYPNAQTVTISDATPAAAIYYTTNGSTPTVYSALYTGSIAVSASETVVAIAANGYAMSAPVSAQYLITSSSSSFIYTAAGDGSNGYSGDGGPATAADLNNPAQTALDSAGNLYIADSYNSVVRKVAAGTGIISTVAGNGTAGYSGDNGAATSAQLNFPASVALDAAGNLYISDSGNFVVRKVTATTGIITTFAGNGTFGYSANGVPATSVALSSPSGITFDPAGNLYIATDGYNLIRKVAAGTGIITTVAGTGQMGYSGDGGPAISATLNTPMGMATDSAGNLYIADEYNNVIRMVSASNGTISTVAGKWAGGYQGGYSGDGGAATSAQLDWPRAVTIDKAGNLYIADYMNQVIRKVTASNAIITAVAGNGSACSSLSGDGGPATSAALCYPVGVSVDGAGNLYISDTSSSRIREVTVSSLPPAAPTPAPVFNVPAGTYAGPQTVTITDPAPGAAIYITMDGSVPSTLSASYNGPIDVSGTVTIQAVAAAPGYLPSAPVTAAYTITSPPTAVITTVAGDGVSGFSGAGGPAASAEFGNTQGLALDAAGDIYFSDTTNNLVWMVTAKTGDISVVAGSGMPGYSGDGGLATAAGLRSPGGLALDSAGNLYIADTRNNVIRKLTASTGLITTVAGNGHAGGNLAAGNGVPATSIGLYQPLAVALDNAGNLYIADSYDNQVRMVSASTGIITAVAGNGSTGFSGDGGPATSAGLDEPNALAIDSAGNLYIATYYSGRIRKVAASTGVITTVAGNGAQFGASGDGGLAINAEIYPIGLALDTVGNLYISCLPAAVREVVASSGVITTVAGNGYWGYSGDGGSATVAGIAYPQGMAFDAANNLYIADSYNYRIRKVAFTGLPATPVIGLASGTYRAVETVEISDITPGTAIYYTTDGSTPTSASSVYTGPITVSASETLQAVAVGTGNATSGMATAAYIIKLPLKPTITWPTPAAITYGTALGATQLDATASVDGTFVYTPAANTVLAAGSQTLSLTFTPTDITDYAVVTTTVKLVVNQAASTVTWAAPSAVTYGTALSATQLDATASVAGTFTYTPAASAVLPAGSQTLSVTFTPTDSTDYTTVTTDVKLTVNQAASTITWATPAAIAYGTALSATQLDATASVAGTFVYTPAAGTVLPLGSQTLSVTFAPTDSTDYTAATATVKLAVNQAASTVAWATPAAITYGTALSAKQLDATASVAGTFAYTPAAGTVLLAGSQTLSVTFTPTDATDYTPATDKVTMVVSKATPAVTETPSASSITTAQTLTVTVDVNAASGSPAPTGSVTLSSGSYSAQQTLAKGAAAFSVAAGSLPAGGDTLAVTYTPDASSAGGYTSASQSATVTVSVPIGSTTPAVTVTPSAATITDQQSDTVSVSVAGASGQTAPSGTLTLASGSYSAQQTLVNGSASFAIKAGALASGADTLTATYSGDANYAGTTGTATVTVSPVVVTVPPPPQVSPGASATATATLSAGSTYSGTMNLSCTLTASPTGAQSLPTCSLNPATITIASGGSGTSVLTVNTTASSTTALARPAGSNLWGIGGGGAVLAALLMFGIPSKRRRWLPMLVLLWVIAAGGVMACGGGGGSSSSSITTHTTPATTSGSYTFTVAGADSANAKITTSTSVSITVQ